MLCYLVLLASLSPMIAGCSGCRSDTPESESEEELLKKREELAKKEKPKPDFEYVAFSTQPGSLETSDRREVFMKPGHWTSAVLETRANNFDFKGELACDVADQQQQPVDLDQMPFRLRTSRPAIMPKGQRRFLEFSLFAPVESKSRWVQTRLLNGPGGRPVFAESQTLMPMPAHQYYFVVLALNPDSYRFLPRLDSITAPTSGIFDPLKAFHYRVVAPRIKSVAPLPSGSLGWTGVAYVLWDDLNPKKLSPEQQLALVDWLHWGGQLIVSGPDTLATLKGSFLDSYLPVEGGDAWDLTTETLSELNSLYDQGDLPLKVARSWTGQKLKLKTGAVSLVASGQEPLVVEQRVGRGRVVVSAFRLSQRELRNWPSFDAFFNGCLLRRAPRKFGFSKDDQVEVSWLDGGRATHDPRFVSRVRYFSRDAVAPPDMFKDEFQGRNVRQVAVEPPPVQQQPVGLPFTPGLPDSEDLPEGSGVAGWSDFSAASNLAYHALREAAGIVVPDASFVVRILGIYILVLVPLNWLVFRLIGRVELAWAAAPFIAIGCAIAVVYLAQLDIGFARSKTELAVLEVQGDYSRAHLTRYLALYSSLGTSYDLRFDDPTAVALPFATGQKMLLGQGRTTVEFRRARKGGSEDEDLAASMVNLEGLEISSNTTGMVHSEEMIGIDGGLKWEHLGGERYKVSNNSRLALQGAGVVSGEKQAWIGSLEPGAAKTVELKPWPKEESKLWEKELDQSPVTARHSPLDGLHLRNLMLLARQTTPDDEFRLVAWTDEEMPGLNVLPSASQSRQLTLVVAHLDYGKEPELRRDASSRRLTLKAAGRSLWEGKDLEGDEEMLDDVPADDAKPVEDPTSDKSPDKSADANGPATSN